MFGKKFIPMKSVMYKKRNVKHNSSLYDLSNLVGCEKFSELMNQYEDKYNFYYNITLESINRNDIRTFKNCLKYFKININTKYNKYNLFEYALIKNNYLMCNLMLSDYSDTLIVNQKDLSYILKYEYNSISNYNHTVNYVLENNLIEKTCITNLVHKIMMLCIITNELNLFKYLCSKYQRILYLKNTKFDYILYIVCIYKKMGFLQYLFSNYPKIIYLVTNRGETILLQCGSYQRSVLLWKNTIKLKLIFDENKYSNDMYLFNVNYYDVNKINMEMDLIEKFMGGMSSLEKSMNKLNLLIESCHRISIANVASKLKPLLITLNYLKIPIEIIIEILNSTHKCILQNYYEKIKTLINEENTSVFNSKAFNKYTYNIPFDTLLKENFNKIKNVMLMFNEDTLEL